MKRWKRSFTAITAGMMTLMSVPAAQLLPESVIPSITANAASGTYTISTSVGTATLEYTTLDDGTIAITDCTSDAAGTLEIPAEIGGIAVTGIGEQAFAECASLTAVQIPESITSIGDIAFMNCTNMTEMQLPDSVTDLGGGIFYGCSSLESVSLPNQIKSLDSQLININCYGFFELCSSLTSVQIPESVTSIGMFAFHGCTSLTEITIPSGVTSISDYTFYSCTALESITFQKGLTRIGVMAFQLCKNLTDVYYTGTESDWSNVQINSSGNTAITNATFHYEIAILQIGSLEISLSDLPENDNMVTLPITIQNNPGFTELAFSITIPSALSYIDADTTSSAICLPSEKNGFIWYMLVSDTPVTDEEIGYLTVAVSENASAGDVYPIILGNSSKSNAEDGCLRKNGASIPYVLGNGTITITDDIGETTGATSAGSSTATTETTSTTIPVEDPSIIWEIEDLYVQAGDEYADININQYNGLEACDITGTFYYPEATRQILIRPDGYTMDDVMRYGDAYEVSQYTVNKKSYETEGLLRFEFVTDGTTIPEKKGLLATMTWSIADAETVEQVADTYGITRQTDPLGGDYYAFPVEWAEDGTIFLGFSTMDGITSEVYQNRFGYFHTGFELEDDIFSSVHLINGTIRIYMDSIPEEPVWSLDTKMVQPGEQETLYSVNIDHAITTFGLHGAIYLPDETMALLKDGFPYGEDTVYAGDGVYAAMSLFQNTGGILGTSEPAGVLWFALQTDAAAAPFAESGELINLTLDIPDEETVIAVAEEYGLEIAITDDGTYYYEFPVKWMEPGTDVGYTVDSDGTVTPIEIQRYSYLNENNADIFESYVSLHDGYIRVALSNPLKTQTTIAETTLTSTETTSATSAVETTVSAQASTSTSASMTESTTTSSTASSAETISTTASSSISSADSSTPESSTMTVTSATTTTPAAETITDVAFTSAETTQTHTSTSTSTTSSNSTLITATTTSAEHTTSAASTASSATAPIVPTETSVVLSSTETLSSSVAVTTAQSAPVSSTANTSTVTSGTAASSAESGTTPAATLPTDYVIWSIDSCIAAPGQQEVNLNLSIENAVASMGLQGALVLPEETMALLQNGWVYGDSTFHNGEVYPSMTLIQNMRHILGTDDGENPAISDGTLLFALESTYVWEPTETNGILLDLTFNLPNEETILAIADEYGMTRQQDGNTSYYEFPIEWAETNTDTDQKYFSYLDEQNQDIFDSRVILKNGTIRVNISSVKDTTETVFSSMETETSFTEATTTTLTTSRPIGTIATKGTPLFTTVTTTTTRPVGTIATKGTPLFTTAATTTTRPVGTIATKGTPLFPSTSTTATTTTQTVTTETTPITTTMHIIPTEAISSTTTMYITATETVLTTSNAVSTSNTTTDITTTSIMMSSGITSSATISTAATEPSVTATTETSATTSTTETSTKVTTETTAATTAKTQPTTPAATTTRTKTTTMKSTRMTTTSTAAATKNTTTTTTAPPDDDFLLGDVDLNGKISIQDAYAALLAYSSASAGLDNGLTNIQQRAADVDQDGAITINDAYRILLYYATASAGGTPSWN